MGPDPLYGWQEIAQYLGGISVGTARRYRKRRGLPVYGLPGSEVRPPVFAIRAELDAWDRNRTYLRVDGKQYAKYEQASTNTQGLA